MVSYDVKFGRTNVGVGYLYLPADAEGITDSALWNLVSGGSMPDTTNTGVPAGTSLTTVTNVTATTGQTISNMNITGTLYQNGDDITVTNCQIRSVALNQRPGGNYNFPVSSGITFSRCTINGIGSVGLDGVTFDKCLIGNTAGTFAQLNDFADNGGSGGSQRIFTATDLTITNCLWTGLQKASGSGGHYEAIHTLGVNGADIENNVFDFRTSDSNTFGQITAALNFDEGNGTGQNTNDVTFKGNWIYGGGAYQIYAGFSNSDVENNQFFSYSGQSGLAYPGYAPGRASFTQANNTRDGSPVTFTIN